MSPSTHSHPDQGAHAGSHRASGSARQVARIDEADCIGCTLCIRACPVDAIVGAARHTHAVVAEWCTGCELCLPPCPVDCIVFEPVLKHGGWTAEADEEARRREEARARRLRLDTISPLRSGPAMTRGLDAPVGAPAAPSQEAVPAPAGAVVTDPRLAVIQGAVERARARARLRAEGLASALVGSGARPSANRVE